MKILKYLILALFLLNLPTTFLDYVSPTIGGILSYASYGLLILYYILKKGGRPNIGLLVIGISYFLISGINFYGGDELQYFFAFIKFLIVIVCGSTLVKNISPNELLIFLFIGSVSIIIEAGFFPVQAGRYGGFYINPNEGGFMVIMAYTLTFQVKNALLRNFMQIVLTLAGLVTFSRSFILIWVLVNLISLGISIKNIKIFAAGFGFLILLVLFGNLFELNTTRLKQFNAVINQQEGSLNKANEESRTETWANYYPYISDKPIFGNGYNSFRRFGLPPSIGVHNSYLLILGESGILPFVFFVILVFYLLIKALSYFNVAAYLFMQSFAFALYMLATHNFIARDSWLILILWMLYKIKLIGDEKMQNQMN